MEGLNETGQRHSGHFALIHLDQSFGGEAGEHFVALGGGEGLRNDSTSWTTGVPLTVLVRKYTPEKIAGLRMRSQEINILLGTTKRLKKLPILIINGL